MESSRKSNHFYDFDAGPNSTLENICPRREIHELVERVGGLIFAVSNLFDSFNVHISSKRIPRAVSSQVFWPKLSTMH
jgi:hypothetical protein